MARWMWICLVTVGCTPSDSGFQSTTDWLTGDASQTIGDGGSTEGEYDEEDEDGEGFEFSPGDWMYIDDADQGVHYAEWISFEEDGSECIQEVVMTTTPISSCAECDYALELSITTAFPIEGECGQTPPVPDASVSIGVSGETPWILSGDWQPTEGEAVYEGTMFWFGQIRAR